MRKVLRIGGWLLWALLLAVVANGCLDTQVSTVTTGKEFGCEENLGAIRDGIKGWQTMNMDKSLPDTLAEMNNVPAEFRTAPDGQVKGYIYLYFKAPDGQHFVLMAYPVKYGFNGERTFFLGDMGSVKARDYGKDYDNSGWDYDSALAQVNK